MINDINRNKTSGGGRGSGGGSKQNPSDDPKQDGCQGQATGGEGTCSLANSENDAIQDVFEMSTKFAQNYLLIFQFQGADARRLFDPLPSSGRPDFMKIVAPLDCLQFHYHKNALHDCTRN